jgi:photosystem II stability/assembly factor-like uncharacterized protein
MPSKTIEAFRLLCISLFLFLITVISSYSQWVQQVSGTDNNLLAVYFLNENTGFLGSNTDYPYPYVGGEIIKTTNGGNNWNRVLLDSSLRAKDFYFFDNNNGIVVGGSYTTVGFIYKTSDGGITWLNITPANLNSHLWNIDFVNATTGFLGGTYGVFKSIDSGNNWIRILSTTPSFPSWSKVYFFDANTGIFATDTGQVYRTTNAGSNWSLINFPSNNSLRDIGGIDANSCLIVGDTLIMRTTDRGQNWSPMALPANTFFYGVQFPVPTTGYLTGLDNVWKSTDSGLTWFSIYSHFQQNLFSLHFINSSSGYVCGDSGVVFKTTSGGVIGINPISTEIPNDYLLFQNYPNPFNPTTNIKFSIPKASFVKLAVYDMLGREMEILVNEYVTSGTYEVKWDATKVSSGVYFYRLNADNFSEVRKMSVIK